MYSRKEMSSQTWFFQNIPQMWEAAIVSWKEKQDEKRYGFSYALLLSLIFQENVCFILSMFLCANLCILKLTLPFCHLPGDTSVKTEQYRLSR